MTMVLAGCLQAKPRVELPADKAQALTARIQDAGTEVVKAKVWPLGATRPCGTIFYLY